MTKPYVAIVLRCDHMVIGYIIDPTKGDGDPLADLSRDSEYVIGEYSKLSDARDALALAMLPSAGGIH